jgi:hypothetical protein
LARAFGTLQPFRNYAQNQADAGADGLGPKLSRPHRQVFNRGEQTMVGLREPILHPVAITDLRPTQMTVGMYEVIAKQKSWQQQDKKKKAEFLGRHMIPVVRGPKQRLYVIDHHHLSLALHREGIKDVLVTIVADLKTLDNEAFWVYLDNRCWVHPYDALGRRCRFDQVPRSVTDLKDDPYRSLAGELRRLGGFAKDTTPFSEFLWADFLRRRITRSAAKEQFAKSLKQAFRLAKSEEASYLPGWCGPHVDH